jgi:hypothetical protein
VFLSLQENAVMTEAAIVYPLIFTYRDAVSGNGFLAGVTITGRALMRHEDEKWWMYGVRPAGIAEAGNTPNETFLSFRQRYSAVLFDIAAESESFEAFREEVERFFYEADNAEEQLWAEAHLLFKSGKVTPEEPFAALKKDSPETRPAVISVARLDNAQRFSATDNVPDTVYIVPPAAA